MKRYGFTRLRFGHEISIAGAGLTPAVENVKRFSSFDDMYDFVTRRFDKYWVTTDACTERELDLLSLRPFFLLVSVDAPVLLRWQRYQARCMTLGIDQRSLEIFLAQSDNDMFSPENGRARLLDRSQVRLVNAGKSVIQMHDALEKLDLVNEERLRPSWDQYFMQLASLAAQRSNCMKRRVGCVLVRESRVISTGYNGTPRGLRNCNEGGCK